MTHPFAIRDLAPEDKVQWLDLWAGYLGFYEVDLDPDVTEQTWARLLDPGSALAARVAVGPLDLLVVAIHLHHPSTWVPGEDCYLDDLFVSGAARGQGAGHALIDDLRALARSAAGTGFTGTRIRKMPAPARFVTASCPAMGMSAID